MVELDYGQIEVGVAAAESGDRDLAAAYNSGDVYAAMAQRFYSQQLTVEERALDPEDFKRRCPGRRDAMKTFVLAVIYNIQARALATRFGISVEEAERERERFLDLFPVLKRRVEEASTCGYARGYASMISGLRRRVEHGGRADSWTRNFLRNTPIQGSATVVFKKAVVSLDRAFRSTNTWMVLPVHDAILIECDRDQVEFIVARATQIMRDALCAYYPCLSPKVQVNCSDTTCWNKDGRGDSLERFLNDPTFQIDQQCSKHVGIRLANVFEEHADTPRDEAYEAWLEERLGELLEDAPYEKVVLWRERYEERAAIMEYEGGLGRPEAERRAWASIERAYRECSRFPGKATAQS